MSHITTRLSVIQKLATTQRWNVLRLPSFDCTVIVSHNDTVVKKNFFPLVDSLSLGFPSLRLAACVVPSELIVCMISHDDTVVNDFFKFFYL